MARNIPNMTSDFMIILRMIRDKYTGTGGVGEKQFPEYHQCALDLLETLATYVPDLLKKEQFFNTTFFE